MSIFFEINLKRKGAKTAVTEEFSFLLLLPITALEGHAKHRHKPYLYYHWLDQVAQLLLNQIQKFQGQYGTKIIIALSCTSNLGKIIYQKSVQTLAMKSKHLSLFISQVLM